MADIAAINRTKCLAILDDDSIVPITNLYDADGDETDDLNEAVAFVAGEGKRWFTRPFSDFEEAPHGPC